MISHDLSCIGLLSPPVVDFVTMSSLTTLTLLMTCLFGNLLYMNQNQEFEVNNNKKDMHVL